MGYNNGIFTEQYKVGFTLTGFNNSITNKNILLFLENTANEHSLHFNMGFQSIGKQNRTWAIVGWKLKVFSRAKDDDTVTVKTWLRDMNKLFIFRDFQVLDKDNNIMAIATSKWCMIDTENHKIARLFEDLENRYETFRDESVFEEKDLPKLLVPDSEPLITDEARIRRFDLDINKHVHNLNYINYAYEVLPEDIFFGNELNNLEIAYKKELTLNQRIKTSLYKENDSFIFAISDKEDESIHSVIKLY